MDITDYKRFFNLTAVCAVNAGDGTSSELIQFVPGQKKQKKTIAFNIPHATDCKKHPLFISVSAQGPFLKQYRDKKHKNFEMNDYMICLFDSNKKLIADFTEIASNDFMSCLSMTQTTLPAGNYQIMVQCDSFETAKLHPEF